MAKKRRHLGEILYKAGLVKKQPLIAAIKASKAKGKLLGEVLLEKGLVNEDVLTKALAKQAGVGYVNLDKVSIPADATKLVPEELIRRHNILPLEMKDGRLKLAVAEQLDLDTMDIIRFRLNAELDCNLTNPTKLRNYIDDLFAEAIEEEPRALTQSEARTDLCSIRVLAQAIAYSPGPVFYPALRTNL